MGRVEFACPACSQRLTVDAGSLGATVPAVRPCSSPARRIPLDAPLPAVIDPREPATPSPRERGATVRMPAPAITPSGGQRGLRADIVVELRAWGRELRGVAERRLGPRSLRVMAAGGAVVGIACLAGVALVPRSRAQVTLALGATLSIASIIIVAGGPAPRR